MYKIFVGNVNFTTSEEQIKEVLPPEIVVEEVLIARDDDGKSKGYAFVLTRDEKVARDALRNIGKPEIDGRRIYFRESRGKAAPNETRPQRRGRPRRPLRPRPRREGYTGGYEGSGQSKDRDN